MLSTLLILLTSLTSFAGLGSKDCGVEAQQSGAHVEQDPKGQQRCPAKVNSIDERLTAFTKIKPPKGQKPGSSTADEAK